MRIIGGKNSRKVLHPPSGLQTRPTTDLAKEALFNILNNYIDFSEVRVLDLFAGSGSISFEFASRGATEVVSVEQNEKCSAFIRKTAAELGFARFMVIKTDVFKFLTGGRGTFDIIFADPPYDMDGVERIPDMVFSGNMLAEDGWLIIEHDDKRHFEHHPAFFEKRKYGRVHFSFFTNNSMI